MIFFFKFWRFHSPLWMQLRKIAHKNSKIETQPRPHSPLPFSVFFFFLSLSSHPFPPNVSMYDTSVTAAPVLFVLDLSSASPSSPSFNGFPTALWRKGRAQAYHLFPIRTHSQEKECALAVQSYSEPKWSHFVEIKDEGRAWRFRHVAVVAVVRAPIPWFSAVSGASQLSDSKKENTDIPALCFFPLLCFSNDCAQSDWLASNLIFEKKEEIDAFEGPHWDRTKVILKQEELPRVRHFFWITLA